MLKIMTRNKRMKLRTEAYKDGYKQCWEDCTPTTRINDMNQAFAKGIKKLRELGEDYYFNPVPEVWLKGWRDETNKI